MTSLFLFIVLIHQMGIAYAGPCEAPKTPRDVLACVKERHPELQKAELNLQAADSYTQAASRWLNPELDTRTLVGKNLGNQQLDVEVAIVQTIETGGKRSARTKTAAASKNRLKADALAQKSEVVTEAVIDLHRLRQIQREKASIDEALSTFGKLVSQYGSRPRLGPEQEVSLAVFKIAKGDYFIKKSQIMEEEREVEAFFRVSAGLELKTLLNALPDFPSKWPSLKPVTSLSSESPAILRAQAALDSAEAEVSAATGEAWPDIQVGPVVQLAADGAARTTLYGMQLTLPLPLWNQNGYGKKAAALNYSGAIKEQEYAKSSQLAQRNRYIEVYHEALEALKNAPSLNDLESKHRNIENKFFRGLISSSLVIEAHRSIIELEKSRHETELRALKALYQIYLLDGRIEEEVL